MSNRYKGSILSSTAAASSSTAAYGIWKQSEVAQLINSVWPGLNDPYWSSVSMLLHGDGTNGAQNNTFIDSSSNAFTVTRNGASTQGTYSPFTATAPYSASVSGGSGYFNSTTDYLNVSAGTTALAYGTGNFTIEFWVYPFVSTTQVVYDQRATSSTVAPLIYINSNVWTYVFGSTVAITGGAPIVNAWQHIAIVKSSGSTKLYINGTQSGSTYTDSQNYVCPTGFPRIGAYSDTAGAKFNGYISNIRAVKGVAVYTANFTPPTAPLTAVSGTALLLNFTNAGVIDNAMQNNLVTVGTSQISTSVFKYGTGSMSFSGTGAWLTAPDRTNLQLSTGDFTIEGWVYINTAGTSYSIISKGAASTGWSVGVTSGNLLQFAYTATSLTGATTLSASTWYYFAVVRSGSGTGNLKIYLNGTADATSAGAVTDNFNQTDILYVGASRTGTTPLNGYIDELRITKGVARYTANFTSPQQAFPNQ